VIVFTSTGFSGNYDYFREYGLTYNLFNTIDVEDKLVKIMKRQKAYMKKGYNFKVLIIFDDIMGCIKIYSDPLKQLLSTHRWYGLSVIFISQFASSIPTFIRELSYYAFVFNQYSKKSLQACYESYFAEQESFAKFKAWFDNKLSVQYSFYFVDRLNKKKMVCKAPANL
jgi:hypothetical protein